MRVECGRWEATPGLSKPAPPPQQGPFQMAKREKIALGPAARKADHSQREMDLAGGSCSSSTNPTRKGLPGGAAHSPTPPLGAGARAESQRVQFLCLPSPPAAAASSEHGLGRARGPRARPGESCCSLEGQEPRGILQSSTSIPWEGAHRAWERCLWKALSRNAASFSQSSSWMNP